MPGRVLVTGAQGFLGRSLVAALLMAGHDHVIGVGRSPRRDETFTHTLDWAGQAVAAPVPAVLRPTNARYSYEQLDVRDAHAVSALVARHRPDLAIHAAASLRGEGLDSLLDSNVRSAYGLLRGFTGRVVLVSSGSVYGAGGGVLPLREDGVTRPVELYGVSKRTAEDIAHVLCPDLVVARVFNLIGPGLQDRHLPAYLAGRLAAIARGLMPAQIPLGPVDTTRDFIDVADAARALVTLADAPAGTYNVASGVETPVQNVVDRLLRGYEEANVSAQQVTFVPRASRAADIPRAVADVTRLADTGFRATSHLDDSLAHMLAYYGAFPNG